MARNEDGRPGDSKRVRGFVERVTFQSRETGFCVLRVKREGDGSLATVVGRAPAIRAGEWIEAVGAWVLDPKFGLQFKAETLRAMPPRSPKGIRRYLASGLIPGIGPRFAARIVGRFGADSLRIIDEKPEKLLQVEGIGSGRLKKILGAWRREGSVREAILFLHDQEIPTGTAERIHREYGEETIRRVREDPFSLARDIRGVGFKTADDIARRLGIPPDAPQRIRAGIDHVLERDAEEGHCAAPRGEIVEKSARMLGVSAGKAEGALDEGLLDGRLIQERVGKERLVFPSALHRAECRVAERLAALAGGGVKPSPVCPSMIRKIFSGPGRELSPSQRRALQILASSPVAVLTGGPGVGKTTLVKAVVSLRREVGGRVVLCAPTGRAAKRLSEATGRRAKTIHRLLAWEPGRGGFRHGPGRPLSGDLFVVDEASMIDLFLAAQFLSALPGGASLILVGDVDQLPSVGPGNVLRDCIESGRIPVCRLTEVFRQSRRSSIVSNAHLINRGKMPVLPSAGSNRTGTADFYFVEADEPRRGAELILKMVAEALPRRFGIHPIEDVQVLSPMIRGELGVAALNASIQEALNPSGPSVERFGRTYRIGDRVLQTVNDYEKDVFNGDIGRIAAVDAEHAVVRVRFDGRTVSYPFGELDALSLSYAMTVHKSQGGEFPVVVLPVHTQHWVMLRRNLLYTAITRARRIVVLVGTRKALRTAVSRGEASRRRTCLAHRIRAAMEARSSP